MIKRYFIFTLGCQMNESDSERISAVLDSIGFKPSLEKEADLIVCNACSVRQKPIDRIWGKIKTWSEKKPKPTLVLTGCVLKKDLIKFKQRFDFCFKIEDLHNLSEWLGSKERKQKARSKNLGYLETVPNYQQKEAALVPIMTGCNNYCSYCAVPLTRGREISRREKDIVREVRCLIEKRYGEIILLGQNVNSYKSEKEKAEINFVKLLEKLVKIKGDFRIKFLSAHPKDFSDELIDLIAREKKLSKEIHLPLQSGDNTILKKMNRNYTRQQYLRLVKKLQHKIKNLQLSTDFIVGYPDETKQQFNNTLRLAKCGAFKNAFISIYSPREGTFASKMVDNVPIAEKQRRWRILNNIINKKAAKAASNTSSN